MRILVVPDSQNGFDNDSGEPLHDEAAWECVFRAARVLRPDRIIMLGDMLDLAPFSKYRVKQGLRGTTQRTLDDMKVKLARMRRENRGTVIDWLEGNHEARIQNALTDALPEAATVHGFTLPALLDLHKYAVNYHAPYGSQIVCDNVRYTHGHAHATYGGQTAGKYLSRATNRSIVYGHCHKSELAWRRTDDGSVFFAMSPGTIAHVDGRVPGTTLHPDWQQGLAVVENGIPELCPIVNGAVWIRGRWV
jgi:predicted phosphodiesterase